MKLNWNFLWNDFWKMLQCLIFNSVFGIGTRLKLFGFDSVRF